MKTFRMIGMALVAVMLGFAMSSCENDDEVDPYKDYPQLIVGQWFNFTPEASMFLNYNEDGTFNWIGWDKENEAGWLLESGEYRIEGNKLIWTGTIICVRTCRAIKFNSKETQRISV